jgi:hypothetical protein
VAALDCERGLVVGQAPQKPRSPAPPPPRTFQVVHGVLSGRRLERPSRCPQEVYALMLSCWAEDPAARPSFEEVIARFK